MALGKAKSTPVRMTTMNAAPVQNPITVCRSQLSRSQLDLRLSSKAAAQRCVPGHHRMSPVMQRRNKPTAIQPLMRRPVSPDRR